MTYNKLALHQVFKLVLDTLFKASIKLFRATEGSTVLTPLVFGAETARGVVAANKLGKWLWGDPLSSRTVHQGHVAKVWTELSRH